MSKKIRDEKTKWMKEKIEQIQESFEALSKLSSKIENVLICFIVFKSKNLSTKE